MLKLLLKNSLHDHQPPWTHFTHGFAPPRSTTPQLSPSEETQQSAKSEWVQPTPASPPGGNGSGGSDSDPDSDTDGEASPSIDTDDPPDVESNWWKGLVIALVAAPFLLIILLLAVSLSPSGNSQVVLPVVVLTGVLLISLRVVFPVCIYLDARTLQSAPGVSGPRATPYIIGTLLAPPPIEFLTNILYLAVRGKYARKAKDGASE